MENSFVTAKIMAGGAGPKLEDSNGIAIQWHNTYIVYIYIHILCISVYVYMYIIITVDKYMIQYMAIM